MKQPHIDTLRGEALELLLRATSGHATVADLRELQEWRDRSVAHAEAYARATGIWSALGTATAESVTSADRALIAGHHDVERRPLDRRELLAGGALAAGVAAVAVVRPPLGLWPSLSDLRAEYRTDTNEHRTVTLAEGASVEMNTRTSISRLPTDDDGERIELLSGEAAILVPLTVMKPLIVVADDGQVVLPAAAQINLRHDGSGVRVTCLTGSVKVECRGNDAALRPGEQIVYSSRGISSIGAVDPSVITAWRQGLLVFRDAPLEQVLHEVNRYWRGRIVLLNSELGRRRVTVRIELARIDEVISYVRSVLGARVRSLPGGVVILT